jgi:hypothetical protein
MLRYCQISTTTNLALPRRANFAPATCWYSETGWYSSNTERAVPGLGMRVGIWGGPATGRCEVRAREGLWRIGPLAPARSVLFVDAADRCPDPLLLASQSNGRFLPTRSGPIQPSRHPCRGFCPSYDQSASTHNGKARPSTGSCPRPSLKSSEGSDPQVNGRPLRGAHTRLPVRMTFPMPRASFRHE